MPSNSCESKEVATGASLYIHPSKHWAMPVVPTTTWRKQMHLLSMLFPTKKSFNIHDATKPSMLHLRKCQPRLAPFTVSRWRDISLFTCLGIWFDKSIHMSHFETLADEWCQVMKSLDHHSTSPKFPCHATPRECRSRFHSAIPLARLLWPENAGKHAAFFFGGLWAGGNSSHIGIRMGGNWEWHKNRGAPSKQKSATFENFGVKKNWAIVFPDDSWFSTWWNCIGARKAWYLPETRHSGEFQQSQPKAAVLFLRETVSTNHSSVTEFTYNLQPLPPTCDAFISHMIWQFPILPPASARQYVQWNLTKSIDRCSTMGNPPILDIYLR